MRILYGLSYVLYLMREIISGSVAVARYALSSKDLLEPSIIELPLECRTDLEITWMASSITITPGTLVLGTAAGTATDPPTLFVHSMFSHDRQEIVGNLREMESRLLRMTRGNITDREPS